MNIRSAGSSEGRASCKGKRCINAPRNGSSWCHFGIQLRLLHQDFHHGGWQPGPEGPNSRQLSSGALKQDDCADGYLEINKPLHHKCRG